MAAAAVPAPLPPTVLLSHCFVPSLPHVEAASEEITFQLVGGKVPSKLSVNGNVPL